MERLEEDAWDKDFWALLSYHNAITPELQRAALVDYGQSITATLDFWQSIGATLADLCNLCNRDYTQVLKEIKPERVEREFSSLIFVYNLDYKDPRNRGWIDFDVDAPFTHAVKEFFLDRMINTPEGREAFLRFVAAVNS